MTLLSLSLRALYLLLFLVALAPPAADADGKPEAPPGGALQQREKQVVRADEQPKRKKRRAKETPSRQKRVPTAVLPHPGTYRAPAILRLAADLYGLPVHVASKKINDIPIEIPNQLARRPLTLEEMKIFLAAHSLYLHIWDRSEQGRLLVASRDPHWKPDEVRHRKIVTTDRRSFGETWAAIKSSVDAHNARLSENARRIVAVPHPRTGKIFLWSPRKDWLEDLGRVSEVVQEERVEDRARLRTYKGRHRLAADLERALHEKLSESERSRVRVSVAPWGNHLIYRADQELGARVRGWLERLDQPARHGG